MKRSILLVITIASLTASVFADWKLTQKTKISGEEMGGRTSTIYQKGVRQRREEKIDMGTEDPEVAAMMAQMGQSMPTFPAQVSQCDLKQDLFINEKNRSYFIDYYDWSALSPEKLQRRPNQKVVIRGTMTTDTSFTDSGKRQQMFGLAARWLKVTQTIETSADSCDGASSSTIVQEGWFVTLSLESESCPIRPPTGSGGCRPKLIVKRNQNPGIMITGTMRVSDGRETSAFQIETTELSKATLDPALFDIPKGFAEVDSQTELSTKRVSVDTSARTVYSDGPGAGAKDKTKTIAIDFFSGSSSKLDQSDLRSYISSKVTAAGMSGFPINSQSELAGGNFANVIGVEITKIKESGASKIGGLFGKVTGTDDGAKLGTTSAEIVITVYGKDGKTVIATAPARAEIKGKPTDAVRAAIDQVIDILLKKIK